MNADLLGRYSAIRSGTTSGFFEQDRGLIAVSGKEAVQFLDGLISNDMKTLADGQEMLAAFPNAQGRLLAVVRVKREGERFLFETESATREKLYQNLFRFTFAGDFFVEDLSEEYRYYALFGPMLSVGNATIEFKAGRGPGIFVPLEMVEATRAELNAKAAAITGELYELLRIECGIPKYGVDMDESTIVPELGLDGLISYTKGCYIGQEIIARIHFRGHVANQLTGLVLSEDPFPSATPSSIELTSADGKSAGRLTSTAFSPKLEKRIALAYVRYEHLAPGTVLKAGNSEAVVTELPFVSL